MIKAIVTSLKPVDFTADGAVTSLNGCITNKYKAVINFTFQKYTSTQKRLQFASVSGVNTISNINGLDSDSFIDTYNFLVGETIIIPASVHNAITLTIIGVSDDMLTVSNTLTTEILEVGYIYVNKKITSLDFYYNLLANSDSVSFISKTDKQTFQKYTVSGIDPTVSAPAYLQIGTKSFGWVTDIITAPSQSTSTIAGAGMTAYTGITTAYIQSFTITHYFYEAPFFTKEQYQKFLKLSPPNDFNDAEINGVPIANGWQYAFQINTKYATGSIYQDSVVSFGNYGTGAWFNMNNSRTSPEFIFSSISYVNAATAAVMSALDIGQDVNVTINIKSVSGLFFDQMPFVMNYFYCPLDDTTYQNTATTLLQNFMFDKCLNTLNSGGSNGINYGTNYQVLKSVRGTMIDASNATIQFTVSYAVFLQTILKAKNTLDRNYAFSICCETIYD